MAALASAIMQSAITIPLSFNLLGLVLSFILEVENGRGKSLFYLVNSKVIPRGIPHGILNSIPCGFLGV